MYILEEKAENSTNESRVEVENSENISESKELTKEQRGLSTGLQNKNYQFFLN